MTLQPTPRRAEDTGDGDLEIAVEPIDIADPSPLPPGVRRVLIYMMQGPYLRADANTPSPVLSNTTYDIVKDTVTIAFPAAVTLYAGLAAIWGWGFSEEVVATGGVIGIFLGVLLKIASKKYEKLPLQYDGELIAGSPTSPSARPTTSPPNAAAW